MILICTIAYMIVGAFFCWYIAWDEKEVGNDPKNITRNQWGVVFTFWPLWVATILAISAWENRIVKK